MRDYQYYRESKKRARDEWFAKWGGLLFVGFLGLLIFVLYELVKK